MRSIGVRELRQHASEYLRLVKAGETVEITERGEPIARLTPLPRKRESGLERLAGEGLVIPPKNPRLNLREIARYTPMPGQQTGSEALFEDRDADPR